MKTNILFIAVLVLFDGVAVAWAAWEFWSIRKTKVETVVETSAVSSALKETPGHPEGEHGPNEG